MAAMALVMAAMVISGTLAGAPPSSWPCCCCSCGACCPPSRCCCMRRCSSSCCSWACCCRMWCDAPPARLAWLAPSSTKPGSWEPMPPGSCSRCCVRRRCTDDASSSPLTCGGRRRAWVRAPQFGGGTRSQRVHPASCVPGHPARRAAAAPRRTRTVPARGTRRPRTHRWIGERARERADQRQREQQRERRAPRHGSAASAS
jgi:hypothetical protein